MDRIVEVYTCHKCKGNFPDISNSPPIRQGELCVSCFIGEENDKYDDLPTSKCKQCGREFPILPMYFNQYGLCLICNQE